VVAAPLVHKLPQPLRHRRGSRLVRTGSHAREERPRVPAQAEIDRVAVLVEHSEELFAHRFRKSAVEPHRCACRHLQLISILRTVHMIVQTILNLVSHEYIVCKYVIVNLHTKFSTNPAG
jgi:hypothetical protein